MKLTRDLTGRTLRQDDWPKGEFVKIKYVGQDFALGVDHNNKEVVFAYEKHDITWDLVYPYIILKPVPPEIDPEV